MTDTATLAARLEKLEERQRRQEERERERDAMADILARAYRTKEAFVCRLLGTYVKACERVRCGAFGLHAKILNDERVMNRLQSQSYGGGWDLRDMAIDVENMLEHLESETDGGQIRRAVILVGIEGVAQRDAAREMHVTRQALANYWQRGVMTLWEWLGDYDPERN